MSESEGKLATVWADEAWPLYGAAFFMAVGLSVCWTAMPFVLRTLGGTEAHVGYAPAAHGLAYMAALLLTGSLLGHLDAKRATQAAAAVTVVAAAVMVLAVLAARRPGDSAQIAWVWVIISAGALAGASMALFWPFLMSWVSARYEGVALNRRFGRYNGAWSGGALIGPLVGASLVELDPSGPMLASLGTLLLVCALLGLGRRNGGSSASEGQRMNEPATADDGRRLISYRWMSRAAMFAGWVCFAIVRSQFALRFTDLGYSESQYGVLVTVLAGCNFVALIAAGRWAFWHYRPGPLLAGQGMLLLAMLMVLFGRTFVVFLAAVVTLGLAFGFGYSSHLYYGASASEKRSVRMTIHEIVISLAITIGSFAGGYLAEHVGLLAPYWFAIGVVTLGGVAQLIVLVAVRSMPPAQAGADRLSPQ
jgi:MFS family permease